MKSIIGRIVSTLITAGIWALVGIRTVLDFIGYSTIPEDLEVAQTRIDQLIELFLSIPWWVPWGFALISTLWLMRVSWPGPHAVADISNFAQEPTPTAPPEKQRYVSPFEGKTPALPAKGMFSHDQQARAKATPIINAELDTAALNKINPRLSIRFAVFNGNPNMTDITRFSGSIRILGEELFENFTLEIASNSVEASEFFWFTLRNELTKEMAEFLRRAVSENNHLVINFVDARFHLRMRVPDHPSGVSYSIRVPETIQFDCKRRGHASQNLLAQQGLLWPEND